MVLMVFFSSRISPLDIDSDFLGKVAVGDGRRHLRDVSHLIREVTGHEVHDVGEILPGSGDALHLGLPAELSFGTDFAGHTGDFGGECRSADPPSC